MMSTKVFKHDYNKQADNLARSAFEKPKMLSRAPARIEEDDFEPPVGVHFPKEVGHKVSITVFPDRFGGRGGGRITFSSLAADLLELDNTKYIQFLYSKSKDEWVLRISESNLPDSYAVRVTSKPKKPNSRKNRIYYMVSSIAIAKLLFASSGLEDKRAFSLPLAKEPDQKGRYSIVTRLAKTTGREKKPA